MLSFVAAGAITVSLGVVQATPSGAGAKLPTATTASIPAGISKIKHVVVLMQENRSYDSYFGALHSEGQPASPAEPTTGNPDPLTPGATVRAVPSDERMHRCRPRPFVERDASRVERRKDGRLHRRERGPGGSQRLPRDGRLQQARSCPTATSIAQQVLDHDPLLRAVLSQTFPNRIYLLTGTSFGTSATTSPRTGDYTQKTIFQLLDRRCREGQMEIYLARPSRSTSSSATSRSTQTTREDGAKDSDAAPATLPQTSPTSLRESRSRVKPRTTSTRRPTSRWDRRSPTRSMQALVNGPTGRHGDHPHLRRARRLLRPRGAAARGGRQHPADAPAR